jgi:alcohol dehydrogenase/propanol-preferring alcohol dehydrogenase
MGHEIVGRVAKLGPDATGVKVGDLRIVFPWLGCGECEKCLAEEDNMCSKAARSLGVFANGGYGTHVIAPHPRHLVDPGSLDPALAATYACSGITVYSAIKKAMPLKPDQAVVLVGAGGLGLNAIAVLKALGHKNIISVDISAEKREAALAAGAAKVVDGSGEGAAVTKRIIEAACGPVPAVIDLVNGTATAGFAFAALDKGGKLIQVGLFGGSLTVALPVMAMRAVMIQGSYVGNPKELRELVKLAQEGTLQALPVTTIPQNRADEALMRLRDGKVTGRLVLKAEAA